MSDGPVEEACEVVAVEGADATSLTDSQLSQALAPLEWRRLRQAAQPTQAALLAVLDQDLAMGDGTT